nr:hypothetical protein [uncultured Rhodoferax sp.]
MKPEKTTPDRIEPTLKQEALRLTIINNTPTKLSEELLRKMIVTESAASVAKQLGTSLKDQTQADPAKSLLDHIESMLSEEQRAELMEVRALHARMLPEWRSRITNFLGKLSPQVLLDLREDGTVGFRIDASPISAALKEYRKGLELRPEAFGPEAPSL